MFSAVAIGAKIVAMETPGYRMGLCVLDWRDVHLRGHCPVCRHLSQGPRRPKRQYHQYVRALGVGRNHHMSDGSMSTCSARVFTNFPDQGHCSELEYVTDA